jgi:hypothetical protein
MLTNGPCALHLAGCPHCTPAGFALADIWLTAHRVVAGQPSLALSGSGIRCVRAGNVEPVSGALPVFAVHVNVTKLGLLREAERAPMPTFS